MKRSEITIPIEFEYLLTRLFGRSYYQSVGPHSFSSWKKICLRIVIGLRCAITVNIDSDDYHRDSIIEKCNDFMMLLKKSKNINAINTTLILLLVETNFMLIGHLPDNYKSKSVSAPQQWKASTYRKIVYIKSPEQKVNLILSLTDRGPYTKRLPSFQKLYDKLHNECRGDDKIIPSMVQDGIWRHLQ